MFLVPKFAFLVVLFKLWELTLGVANNIYSTFDVSTVRSVAYGVPLYTFTVRSKLECFMYCSQREECVSLQYEPLSKRCATNRVAANASVLSCSDAVCLGYEEVKYASKSSECASTIRQSCAANVECLDTFSECRGGVCKCLGGYSHSNATCECVTECTSGYGTTFQENVDVALENNDEKMLSGLNLAQCQAMCLQETSFVCASFDLGQKCYLHRYTPMKRFEPGFSYLAYGPYAGVNVYVRDCA